MGARVLGRGSAPGKVILLGEHAVVYGRPAIAVPVTRVQAEATVTSGFPGEGVSIYASDLDQMISLATAPRDDPLAAIVRITLHELGISSAPDWVVCVRSTIPMAAGMGSGAAVSAAIVRALAAAAGYELPSRAVSELVYQVERLHHGIPSGIDNTVVSYACPIYFIKGQSPQPLRIARPFWLVIGDTGVPSPTKAAVLDVRRAWEAERASFEELFDRIAALVEAARAAIETGAIEVLGPLMNENQALLREIGVSSLELERLIETACAQGASGAKLVGAGRGGNMIALVEPEQADRVAAALRAAGAVRTIVTQVDKSSNFWGLSPVVQ
jgi:mevalonate kinase